MKRIFFLMLCVVAMTVSSCASAQGYYPKHHLPARGYADPYSHSWSSGRTGVHRHWEPRKGRGYRPARSAVYVAHDILHGLIVLDRIFAPYCTSEYYGYFDSHAPNRWVAGRMGMPFWPYRYMNNSPFYWYPTSCGNTVFYTSTNVMMGVTIDDQVQLIRDKNTLYVWDTRGRMLSRNQLYEGYHAHLDMDTQSGVRLVEVFYDGVCRVNYLDINGNVIESYALY